jgi:hypothetical protein
VKIKALPIIFGLMLMTPCYLFSAGGKVKGPNEIAPDPMSDFIKNGEWGPGFNAQNKMLDEHAERYNLQDQDWRPQKPWYEPEEN